MDVRGRATQVLPATFRDDIRVGLLLRIQARKDLRLHPRAPGCSIVWVETVSVSGVQSRKE